MALLPRALEIDNSQFKAEECVQNTRGDGDAGGSWGRYPEAATPSSHSKTWNRRVRHGRVA